MYQVVDAAGRVIELDDGEPCPDGCSLRVSTVFMDGVQRAVMRGADPHAISDEQAQVVHDAYVDFKSRVSRGMRRHQVPTERPDGVADGEDFDHRAAAYHQMKMRLSDAWKAKRVRKPVEPEWLR